MFLEDIVEIKRRIVRMIRIIIFFFLRKEYFLLKKKQKKNKEIPKKKMDSTKSIDLPKIGSKSIKIRKMFWFIVEKLFIFLLLVLLLPLYLFLSLVILFFSGWPIFFIQERVGYRGKIFKMYKFRTMKIGSERRQNLFKKMNEADGPVFKIKNDPRFTKIGKFLSHSGLDELPQFLNVFFGDMKVVGPRPLPVNEALKIPINYKETREGVYPGIISPWVFNGYHNMTFKQWMESDLNYIENKSFKNDLKFFIDGVLVLVKLIAREI